MAIDAMNNSAAYNDSTEIETDTHDTFTEQLLLVFKLLVSIAGVIGNLVAIIVLRLMPSHRFKFLMRSQAFIDLLASVMLLIDTVTRLAPTITFPIPPPRSNVFGHLHCLFWSSGVLFFSLLAISTFNLIAISIERYMSVFFSKWYRSRFTSKKIAILGLVAWIVAPTMQFVYFLPHFDYKEGECVKGYMKNAAIGVMLFIWEFFFPCVIMGMCYVRICLHRYRQGKPKTQERGLDEELTTYTAVDNAEDICDISDDEMRNVDDDGTNMSSRRNHDVTKTFLIAFVLYVLCWITNQVLFLQYNLGGYNHWNGPENHFSKSLVLINSACNPFIYIFHLKPYRDKVKFLFRLRC